MRRRAAIPSSSVIEGVWRTRAITARMIRGRCYRRQHGRCAGGIGGFEAKQQTSVGVAIERRAEPRQLLDGGGRGGENAERDGSYHKAVAGFQRIGEMQGEIVVGPEAGAEPPAPARSTPQSQAAPC